MPFNPNDLVKPIPFPHPHPLPDLTLRVADVVGESDSIEGVRGVSHSAHGGVVGINDWTGDGSPGSGGNGGWFQSLQGEGVRGWSQNPNHGGVVGVNTGGGIAVYGGASQNGRGVVGVADVATAVEGNSNSGAGVWGSSKTGEGVHAETQSTLGAAMAAFQMNPDSPTAAFYAEHRGNGVAGSFKGDVLVTGDIKLINADCAEDFDIAGLEEVEPGTVMVIDSEGALRQSDRAYDKRVAGVISGAGNFKPGIVLDKQESSKNRMPIALMGKVYCKVDAGYGAIEVGDLLTTSPTSGHAMKTDDPLKAFGAVIGKALRSLEEGQGLIPILIALQ
ncbi:hypothetical protein [Phormidesmis priestleyi]